MIPTRLLIHDPLVLGTTTGLFPREVDECAGGGDDSALIQDGLFIQRSDRCVPLSAKEEGEECEIDKGEREGGRMKGKRSGRACVSLRICTS